MTEFIKHVFPIFLRPLRPSVFTGLQEEYLSVSSERRSEERRDGDVEMLELTVDVEGEIAERAEVALSFGDVEISYPKNKKTIKIQNRKLDKGEF